MYVYMNICMYTCMYMCKYVNIMYTRYEEGEIGKMGTGKKKKRRQRTR